MRPRRDFLRHDSGVRKKKGPAGNPAGPRAFGAPSAWLFLVGLLPSRRIDSAWPGPGSISAGSARANALGHPNRATEVPHDLDWQIVLPFGEMDRLRRGTHKWANTEIRAFRA